VSVALNVRLCSVVIAWLIARRTLKVEATDTSETAITRQQFTGSVALRTRRGRRGRRGWKQQHESLPLLFRVKWRPLEARAFVSRGAIVSRSARDQQTCTLQAASASPQDCQHFRANMRALPTNWTQGDETLCETFAPGPTDSDSVSTIWRNVERSFQRREGRGK
jgi:hypothetical protein